MDKQKIIDTVNSMIREYDSSKSHEGQDFDAAWNCALWALLDELGLGEEDPSCQK